MYETAHIVCASCLEHGDRAVPVDGVEVGDPTRMDDTGGVQHVDVARYSLEQPTERPGVEQVADHRLDRTTEGCQPLALDPVPHEHTKHARAVPTTVGLREGVRQGGAEPAGSPGDDGGVGKGPQQRDGHECSPMKWRALRNDTAMTDACGLTPGASGSSDASLT